MKRKRFNQEQLTFEECISCVMSSLNEGERARLRSEEYGCPAMLHETLGRWIRNECGLWKHGTDRCVADIVREYKAGRLTSIYLDANRFTHPELPFDLKNTEGRGSIHIDSTLIHPDNCSVIIVEIILQRL
jgi:hypothetical protein